MALIHCITRLINGIAQLVNGIDRLINNITPVIHDIDQFFDGVTGILGLWRWDPEAGGTAWG